MKTRGCKPKERAVDTCRLRPRQMNELEHEELTALRDALADDAFARRVTLQSVIQTPLEAVNEYRKQLAALDAAGRRT